MVDDAVSIKVQEMYYNYYLFSNFVGFLDNIKHHIYVQNTYLRRTPH